MGRISEMILEGGQPDNYLLKELIYLCSDMRCFVVCKSYAVQEVIPSSVLFILMEVVDIILLVIIMKFHERLGIALYFVRMKSLCILFQNKIAWLKIEQFRKPRKGCKSICSAQ